MDEDQIALARQLCTQAGIIMEDASATAILVGHTDAGELASVIQRVRKDLMRALAPADAAGAMMALPR